MKLAILNFLGFTERSLDPTGGEKLYYGTTKKFSGPHVHTRPPETWDSDAEKMVRQVYRNGYTHLALTSYSHGQAAAQAAARVAADLDMPVLLWLACDPVYRAKWLPRKWWLQPFSFRRAMRASDEIEVEPNIRRVVYAIQRINRPNGHRLVATGFLQNITRPIVLQYPHGEIDDSPEWHEICRRELENVTRRFRT